MFSAKGFYSLKSAFLYLATSLVRTFTQQFAKISRLILENEDYGMKWWPGIRWKIKLLSVSSMEVVLRIVVSIAEANGLLEGFACCYRSFLRYSGIKTGLTS